MNQGGDALLGPKAVVRRDEDKDRVIGVTGPRRGEWRVVERERERGPAWVPLHRPKTRARLGARQGDTQERRGREGSEKAAAVHRTWGYLARRAAKASLWRGPHPFLQISTTA